MATETASPRRETPRPKIAPFTKEGRVNSEYVKAMRIWLKENGRHWNQRDLIAVGYALEKQITEGELPSKPLRDMQNLVALHRCLLNQVPEVAQDAWRDVVDNLNPRIKMLSEYGVAEGYPNLCHLAADNRATEERFLKAWEYYCDKWRQHRVDYPLLRCPGAKRYQAQMKR